MFVVWGILAFVMFFGFLYLPFIVAFEDVSIFIARIQPTTRCRKCKYALTGLDMPGVCPECGEPFHEFYVLKPVPKTRLRMIKGRRVFILACLALLILQMWLWSAFAEQIGVLSYINDGYTREVAINATRIRGDGRDAMWSIAAYLWVAPVLTYTGRRARWVLLIAGLITLVIAGANGVELWPRYY